MPDEPRAHDALRSSAIMTLQLVHDSEAIQLRQPDFLANASKLRKVGILAM